VKVKVTVKKKKKKKKMASTNGEGAINMNLKRTEKTRRRQQRGRCDECCPHPSRSGRQEEHHVVHLHLAARLIRRMRTFLIEPLDGLANSSVCVSATWAVAKVPGVLGWFPRGTCCCLTAWRAT
jgi:hypothetical protein